MYAQDSIELLTTSGIQFKKHEDEGIETLFFAELLMTSGVVLCDGVKWLSFHRYDVCLLLAPEMDDGSLSHFYFRIRDHVSASRCSFQVTVSSVSQRL